MNNFKRRVNVIDWHGVYGCFLLCIMGLIGVLTKEKGCYSIATRNKSIMSERLTQFKGKVEEKATRAARVLVPIAGAGIVGGVSEFVPTGAPTDVAALILGGVFGYGIDHFLRRDRSNMRRSGEKMATAVSLIAAGGAVEIGITHGPTVVALATGAMAAVGGASSSVERLVLAMRKQPEENSDANSAENKVPEVDPFGRWRNQAAEAQDRDPQEPHPFGGEWPNH